MSSGFTRKTVNALGDEIVDKIRQTKFCIVGCGGIGANFAEMLARSGAEHINLIDGDKVEESNLNRVFNFYKSDVGQYKVDVIKRRLQEVNSDINIEAMPRYFKDTPKENTKKIQEARNLVCDSDIICIFADNNKSRIALMKLCEEQTQDNLSASIRIDRNSLDTEIMMECGWHLQVPPERANESGYKNDASLAHAIMEVTSVAFSMMLYHLNPNGTKDCFNYYRRSYKGFKPAETTWR